MKTKTIKLNKNSESNILKALNSKQAEAASTINGPVLIVAGAGSGKTRVLTHRIAYLIESGVPPWQILSLTFTNKAAKEMKQRIDSILGNDAANQVWAGTFHSVFARILRYEAEKLGYSSSFSIYDTDDSQRVVKNVMSELGITPQQYPIAGMRARISRAKNLMLTWQDYKNNAETTLEKQTALVYESYDKNLLQNNAMDFDDLLLNFIVLLKKDKETLEKYQNRFKYILVDEYQDTNKAQYIAINMLSKAHSNICVVGDDAQSIYKWRGADINNILDFEKDFPFSKIVRLEQNYRSTKTILKAADSVIINNKKQIPKTLWTENVEGEKIKLYGCVDDRQESATVANIIREKLDGEFDAKDIAILYRTNAQSLYFENSLRRAGINYQIIGGMSFYKRKEVKDTLAYLRILVNSKDDEALVRVINEPPRGLGQTSLKHLRDFTRLYNVSLLEAFRRADENGKLQNRAIASARSFYNMIETHLKMKGTLSPSKLVIQYIESTGILDMYKEINTDEAMDKWNNIQQLLNDISLFFRSNEEATLDDYLQQISLIADIDEKNDDDNKVTLMTLHSAKGLEFPIVIIAGLEQGLFPLMRGDSDRDDIEEERRLFYVGITRAEEECYLMYAKLRSRFGDVQNQQPSIFLKEIDKELIEEKGDHKLYSNKAKFEEKQFFSRNETKTFFDDMPKQKENYSQIPPPSIDFSAGNKVRHSQFGNGRIVSIAGQGKFRKAVVDFENFGRKQLMLEFAKLEKLG